jgi:hypothetical protein
MEYGAHLPLLDWKAAARRSTGSARTRATLGFRFLLELFRESVVPLVSAG